MGEHRQVKTAVRVFSIVETVQRLDGARLVDITDAEGISKGTAHQYLSTLTDLGYLRKDGHEYEVGIKFLNHGIHAREQYDIMSACRPTIKDLVTETGEIVWVVIEADGKAVYVDKIKSDRAVQTLAHIGTSAHLHYLASGKAILSQLSTDRVGEIIEQHGLPARTDQSITSEDALFAELAEVREQGYAINEGEATPGVRAVGAPVTVDGDVYGAISVTGPENRLEDKTIHDRIVTPLLSATNEIELKLGYQIS